MTRRTIVLSCGFDHEDPGSLMQGTGRLESGRLESGRLESGVLNLVFLTLGTAFGGSLFLMQMQDGTER